MFVTSLSDHQTILLPRAAGRHGPEYGVSPVDAPHGSSEMVSEGEASKQKLQVNTMHESCGSVV
jgi:hypothetical protein